MPRRGNSKIYVDDSTFQKRARKLAKKLGVDEYKFVKEQTGILAREVAKMTPPYATFPKLTGTSVGTAKDIKAGEWAVYNDIKKICFIVPNEVAERARRTTQGGPIYRKGQIVSPGVISSISLLSAWHKKNEGSNGRTKDLDVPLLPWVPESLFIEYVKTMKRNVGIAKAAFWKAGDNLGAKGTAVAGIKRHAARASGNGKMKKTNKGPYGLIYGKADGLFHVFKHLPRLERNRLIKAVKRLEFTGRKAAKKSGFKVR
jgi:hypothetical protein